jgi:hypothetical protein
MRVFCLLLGTLGEVSGAVTALPADNLDSQLFETARCPVAADALEAGRTAEGLTIEVAVDPSVVTPSLSASSGDGRVAGVTVTLTNRGGQDLFLTFPDPCFLNYSVDGPDGRPIVTEEMPLVCVTMIDRRKIGPGQAVTTTLDWSARFGPQRPFAPGAYAIRGTLSKRWCGTRELQAAVSRPVRVEVGPAR